MKRPPLTNPAILLATWFGLGYLKPAPGTCGSLGALPAGLALYHYLGFEAFVIGIITVTAFGFWASAEFDKVSGGHDAKEIVIDEVAGQWIALLPVFYFLNIDFIFMGIAFVLFRFFDIMKPWPIGWLDRNLSGAAGVMMDDIVAGIAAAACLYGVIAVV